ncbi:hypothetical protein ACNF42_02215 [Cuniculiplasma sp. SKW3]|uniref:hypothetical protein n=1 Tax=Cuniculiplasma sp. SKW3 TaxID=3400170 RepID=UPI003FD5CAF7
MVNDYEEIMQFENVWYIRKRSYDTATFLKTIAYNLTVTPYMKMADRPREIKNRQLLNCETPYKI